MARKRLPADVDELQIAAIKTGLQAGSSQMVLAVEELRTREEADNLISDLKIEIVPYTIKDASLREIVLKAPDYIIDEIVAALRERRTNREFNQDTGDGRGGN